MKIIRSLLSDKAFTLIEMIIVLFILTAVSGISVVFFQHMNEKQQTKHFLDELKKDIYLAQEYAISHHDSVEITFHRATHSYQAKAQHRHTPVVAKTYDKDIDVRRYNIPLHIKFNRENGNISEGVGKIKIDAPHESYLLVFHPGKGRFYIEKQ